jgi:TonB-dependent SusC/RagA subfamily outer membrane receptor
MEKAKKTKYASIYDMIKGEVAGVQVSGSKVRIRGATSIQGSTDPLLVVNGMVVTDIDDIPPEIVKSIDVLKGPSASLYGSRGANGVIVIKTKGSR